MAFLVNTLSKPKKAGEKILLKASSKMKRQHKLTPSKKRRLALIRQQTSPSMPKARPQPPKQSLNQKTNLNHMVLTLPSLLRKSSLLAVH